MALVLMCMRLGGRLLGHFGFVWMFRRQANKCMCWANLCGSGRMAVSVWDIVASALRCGFESMMRCGSFVVQFHLCCICLWCGSLVGALRMLVFPLRLSCFVECGALGQHKHGSCGGRFLLVAVVAFWTCWRLAVKRAQACVAVVAIRIPGHVPELCLWMRSLLVCFSGRFAAMVPRWLNLVGGDLANHVLRLRGQWVMLGDTNFP